MPVTWQTLDMTGSSIKKPSPGTGRKGRYFSSRGRFGKLFQGPTGSGDPGRTGLERRLYSQPLSANDTTSPSLTTKWSSTRMSTRARATCRRLVRRRSESEGSASPEECLSAKFSAAELCSGPGAPPPADGRWDRQWCRGRAPRRRLPGGGYQVQAVKYLVGYVTELSLEVLAGGGRVREGLAALHFLGEMPARHLQGVACSWAYLAGPKLFREQSCLWSAARGGTEVSRIP